MIRVGKSPQHQRKYTVRRGVYAILPRRGRLLLTVQTAPEIGRDVQLPGGGIDPGENPIPALHREVFEETGWHIAAPKRLGVFKRYTYMPEYDLWAEKICTVYHAKPTVRVAAPTEPHHRDLWLPADQAVAQLGNAGDRLFVQNLLAYV